MQIDTVTEILREAAEVAILPRFRALADEDVSEKSPGEVVTVADREAEALISRRLRDVLDLPVVGEEATAADPTLVNALREAPAAWIVDPVDGTKNFVAGDPRFAVMAALVRDGATVASWILHPVTGVAYIAEKGSGAWRDGVRIHREPAPSDDLEKLRGAAVERFLDTATREHIDAVRQRFAELGPGTSSAGIDYPRLVDGEQDFILFHRTLPWDHAPGTLLLSEAGGVARRLDASPYSPADDRTGLLNAVDEATWRIVRSTLFPDDTRRARITDR